MKVGTHILMTGKLKQMLAGDKIRCWDKNRRSITDCRWRLFSGKLSYLLLVLFFRLVFLACFVRVSLFSFVGEGEKTHLDVRVYNRWKTEIRKERKDWDQIFGSICGMFSSIVHLRNRLGDILYEVSHNAYEMPCVFPTVVLYSWYKQIYRFKPR